MPGVFDNNPVRSCGLVVVFPDERATIWNPDVNGMVERVESSVDGAFVTPALVNGRHPSLVDALAAARFNGCRSAVVAVVDARNHDRRLELAASSTPEFPISVVGCPRDPAAVADAYFSVLLARPAACA